MRPDKTHQPGGGRDRWSNLIADQLADIIIGLVVALGVGLFLYVKIYPTLHR